VWPAEEGEEPREEQEELPLELEEGLRWVKELVMDLPLEPEDVLRPKAPASREFVEGDGGDALACIGQDHWETASDHPRDLYREIHQQN
jgi:hypothetical protein